MWTRRLWLRLAMASAFVSVAMGAFATHGLADPEAAGWIRTGALYEFMHAIAVAPCALFIQLGAKGARRAPAFFLGGTVFFSGSLYAMALGAPRWFGAITPIGGVMFLIGWAILAWAAKDIDRAA